jgi:membrane fusion protein (multidrug efflux system)
MKRFLILIVAATIVAALVLLKIFAFPEKKAAVPAAAAAVAALPVECFVARDTVAGYRVETVGTLLAREQVDVVSEIQRKVVAIHLGEGAWVKAGQLLVKLDDADIAARMAKLEIEAQLAEANEAREKVLLAAGGISQERYDEVASRARTLRAEIAVLKVDLAKTEIRAPFGGKIGLRNISVGALVSPGHVLANLQDTRNMSLDFSVPERYAPGVAKGTAVTFRTDYLGAERTCTVEAVEPSVDQRTRTLLVRASAANADGQLLAGTSAKVYLSLTEKAGAIMVPTNALIPSIKGYSVFLVKGGKAVAAPVKTGNRSSELVVVNEGVAKGDTVVVTNLLRVRNGSPLTIQKVH